MGYLSLRRRRIQRYAQPRVGNSAFAGVVARAVRYQLNIVTSKEVYKWCTKLS